MTFGTLRSSRIRLVSYVLSESRMREICMSGSMSYGNSMILFTLSTPSYTAT
jgi:hypothetical protein